MKEILQISLFFILIIFFSCRKEPDKTPPVCSFISDSSFTFSDRIVPIGMPVKIGFKANTQGSAITNLVIKLETENGIETALDTGIYVTNFSYTKTISYGASQYEKWTFTIRDKAGNMLSKSIILTKDPNSSFGLISHYPSIILGTQYNTSVGSFLALTNMQIFKSDSASFYQNQVNLMTYWGDILSPATEFTFSSPGDNDAPVIYPFTNSWAIPKNEIRYKADSTSISTTDFDNAYNDSLIISNYTNATIGKRKFKNTRTGYVIPFLVSSGPLEGKRGLIKVKSLQNTTLGFIEIEMKIQK